jgi:hypothetical protein
MINAHVESDFIKWGARLSIYSNSLDLELDQKEIRTVPLTEIVLGEHDISKENVILLIQGGENENVEFKSSLSFDYIKNCEVEGKEFDVMRAIDSFLNFEGGVLMWV